MTNDEQHIVWEEYGLRLHIHHNALPEDCSYCQLKIAIFESERFELPEDGTLVSAVYSFTHNLGDRKLRNSVTLEMQHCASANVLDHLCVLRATRATYKFEVVHGGLFACNDCYGAIELDRFCFFTTFWRYIPFLTSPTEYCARVFYTNILPNSFQFQIFVFRKLNSIDQVHAH